MKKRSVVISLLVVSLVVLALTGIVNAQGGGEPVADGFNGPMGVFVDADGNIWVIDSGLGGDETILFPNPETGETVESAFGESAQVVSIANGEKTVAANLPSVGLGMENLGGARVVVVDGVVYATSGGWTGDPASTPAVPNTPGVVKIENGEATLIGDTWAPESSQNPDGLVVDSHPYGLAAGPDGNLWVADAGANSLLKVNPTSGEVTVVTAFDGLPSPLPNPARGDALEADPVPTGIAFDGNGNVYVSFLSGFPFIPGSAKVVRVSADGQVSDYATGLTMLTDLRTGPDGNMYAVQFGQFTEQGPDPTSGAIIRIKEGDASEVLVKGLTFPTSLAFNEAGDAYVTTNGVGAPGSGAVVKFSGLTAMEAMAEPAMTEAPAAVEAPAAAAPATAEVPATLPVSGAELPNTAWSFVVFGSVLFIGGLALRRRQTHN